MPQNLSFSPSILGSLIKSGRTRSMHGQKERIFMKWWYWQEKTEILGENLVSKPLYSPQIPNGVAWDRARGSAATDRLSRSIPGVYGNDPLVRGFGHRTARERDCVGLLDIDGIKTVKLTVAGLHQEWLDEFHFGLYRYRYSRLLYMKLTSN